MTRRIFCKVLLVVVAIFGLLVLSGVLSAQGNRDWAFERVRKAQERHTERLMAMNGVEGTAIGYNQNDQLAVKVFTAGPGVRGIPQQLEDVPVQVVITGKFYALDKPDKPPGKPDKPPGKPDKPPGKPDGEEELDPTSRFPRPVPIGVSTGNEGERSAGTIGCRVTKDGKVYALSNNHVYALRNEAPIDSRVLQPGRYDGGKARKDTIGTLADFEPIKFDGSDNTIDVAIALCSVDNLGNATPADDPDGYGTPSSTTATAYVGLEVQKYGRNGQTFGEVDSVNATVIVYYSTRSAIFVEQILITPGTFSAGGDSGSLIVTQDGKNPVGLLFAGSSISTVANPIGPVLTRFGVTIDGD